MSDQERISIFIKDVKSLCRKHKIKFVLKRGKKLRIEKGIYGSGYFDPNTSTLAVAKKSNDFLAILVHESCHLDQWIEGATVWKRSFDGGAGSEVDDYTSGKDVPNIKAAFSRVRALELDCERRSMIKINKYELPINQVVYAQKANVYIQLHNYMLLTKKWYATPYKDPNIYTAMPKRLMSDSYYKKLPIKVKRIFDQFLH